MSYATSSKPSAIVFFGSGGSSSPVGGGVEGVVVSGSGDGVVFLSYTIMNKCKEVIRIIP